MAQPVSSSPALPIARVVLRILIVLNWVGGAAILALLLFVPNAEWIKQAFNMSPSLELDRMIFGLRAIAVIGLFTIPMNHEILRRLLAMVDTVRAGDPFVTANAVRLQAIAWTLLALQILSIAIGAIARTLSTADHPVKMDAGFSLTAWLTVLLVFLLARVFAEGARMRDDLEGTV